MHRITTDRLPECDGTGLSVAKPPRWLVMITATLALLSLILAVLHRLGIL